MYDPLTVQDLLGFTQIVVDSFSPFALLSVTILLTFVIAINIKKLIISDLK